MFGQLPSWVEPGHEPTRTAVSSPRSAAPSSGRAPVQLSEAEKGLGGEAAAWSCSICRKSFKRETNLMFHMATHRDRVVDSETGAVTEQKWDAPTACTACPRVFATKYQAKKHFLRKHFVGEKKYICTVCKTKAFSVKEDWSMHMRSCGRFFSCSCGITLRSQATLKRHCKSNGHGHMPTSLQGTPMDEDALAGIVGLPPGVRAPAIGACARAGSLLSRDGDDDAGGRAGEEEDLSDFDADLSDVDDDLSAATLLPPTARNSSNSHECGDGSRASFETRAYAPAGEPRGEHAPWLTAGADSGKKASGGGGGHSTTTAGTMVTECTEPQPQPLHHRKKLAPPSDSAPPPPFVMPWQQQAQQLQQQQQQQHSQLLRAQQAQQAEQLAQWQQLQLSQLSILHSLGLPGLHQHALAMPAGRAATERLPQASGRKRKAPPSAEQQPVYGHVMPAFHSQPQPDHGYAQQLPPGYQPQLAEYLTQHQQQHQPFQWQEQQPLAESSRFAYPLELASPCPSETDSAVAMAPSSLPAFHLSEQVTTQMMPAAPPFVIPSAEDDLQDLFDFFLGPEGSLI